MTRTLDSAPGAALSALHGAQFDHIGVVVKTMERGRAALSRSHGIQDWTAPLTDPLNGVHILFGRDPSGVVYELLAPIDASSPVQPALVARKNLLNHIAYRVVDLAQARERMLAAGCAPTADPKPALAFGGGLIQFFVTPLNIVIELIEALHHEHRYVPTSVSDITVSNLEDCAP